MKWYDHTGSSNRHKSTNDRTTNELVDSCNSTQTQHQSVSYVEISGTILFDGGGGLGKGTGTERSPALSSLSAGCEAATALLGFCVHKPLSVANWTSRFDVEEAENSSIIGIWRMFILGVITIRVFVLISIQSAFSNVSGSLATMMIFSRLSDLDIL